jgi:hypothetical protein
VERSSRQHIKEAGSEQGLAGISDARAREYLNPGAQRRIAGMVRNVLGGACRGSLATADGAIYLLRDGEHGPEFKPVFIPGGVAEGALRFPLNILYQDSKGRIEEVVIIGYLDDRP